MALVGGGLAATDVVVSLEGKESTGDGTTIGSGDLQWSLDAVASFATNATALAESGYNLGALKKLDCNGDFDLHVVDLFHKGTNKTSSAGPYTTYLVCFNLAKLKHICDTRMKWEISRVLGQAT